MALHVYNTLTRRKELFTPAHPLVVRIYTCGLTVYAPMHIGHARTYCFWDFFRRYLEYLGYHVLAAINYTDIDDRNIANADGTQGPVDLAERVIASFRRDCRALKIKDYAVYTRATDFTAGQIEMVAQLLDKGHAYVVDGEVFYDISSFPGYGKLSGKRVEEQEVGASGRVAEDASRKHHPADFTLWKPTEPGQPAWATVHSEWPLGRPGWHIECSTMSSAVHGCHFDVHGGGVDNLFPHHENEIAQSEPLCGSPWVRYWMHPEHLDLRGEKMSKSLGNVVGVPDLLAKHRVDEVRWFYAMTHYRSKLAFGDDLLDAAKEGFARIARLVRNLERKLEQADAVELRVPAAGLYASQRSEEERVPRLRHQYAYGRFGSASLKLMRRFREALDDDLNAPQATAALFDYTGELYGAGIEDEASVPDVLAAYRCLVRHLYVLGCEFPNEHLYPELSAECFAAGGGGAEAVAPYKAVVDKLLAARQEARKAKDFAKSDLIRDLLSGAGVAVEDTPQGPRWELMM